MQRFTLMASGVLAVFGMISASHAQTQTLNGFGTYPVPPNMSPGVGGGPGGYVVAPNLPGTGGSYGYVQQGTSRGGMSPNAYYSENYFTSTPMGPNQQYTYGAGYQGYNRAPVANQMAPRTTTYQTPMTQTAPAYTYGPATNTSSYAQANAQYYRARRSGPFRRMMGRNR